MTAMIVSETMEQHIRAGRIVLGMSFNQRVWALTARIRENGMPDGVIAHSPDGFFHEPSITAELNATYAYLNGLPAVDQGKI